MVNLHVVARGASHSAVREDVAAIVEEAGLSLAEIALALGMSPRTVQTWAQGRYQPNGWVYARLLELKRLAFYAGLAMPFNTPEQRRRWWLSSSADHELSPLQLVAGQDIARVQALIESSASAFGRRLLSTPLRRVA